VLRRRPGSITSRSSARLVDFRVQRVLDQLGLDINLVKRWEGSEAGRHIGQRMGCCGPRCSRYSSGSITFCMPATWASPRSDRARSDRAGDGGLRNADGPELRARLRKWAEVELGWVRHRGNAWRPARASDARDAACDVPQGRDHRVRHTHKPLLDLVDRTVTVMNPVGQGIRVSGLKPGRRHHGA